MIFFICNDRQNEKFVNDFVKIQTHKNKLILCVLLNYVFCLCVKRFEREHELRFVWTALIIHRRNVNFSRNLYVYNWFVVSDFVYFIFSAFWHRIESFTSSAFRRNWRIFCDCLSFCIRRRNVHAHKIRILYRCDKLYWCDRIFNSESIISFCILFRNIRKLNVNNRRERRFWSNDSSSLRWRVW
jgi:hypothetical protein